MTLLKQKQAMAKANVFYEMYLKKRVFESGWKKILVMKAHN
jgi:hypothetical protein